VPGFGYAIKPVDVQGRPLAEWWQRLVAILIDFALYSVVSILIEVTLLPVLFASSATNNNLLLVQASGSVIVTFLGALVVGAATLAYFAFLEGGPKGQTLGKMAVGIAAVDATTGDPIGPKRALLRRIVIFPNLALNLIPIIGPILAGLAYLYVLLAALWPLWGPRRQGLHDKAANTTVVVVR
jgi:uncharacterized RDD family membrane protein YckC